MNFQDMGGISLKVEMRQLEEAVSALLHTVLFHRSLGEVEPEDYSCHSMDLTFAMCSRVKSKVSRAVKKFIQGMAKTEPKVGEIVISFVKKTKRKYFGEDKSRWEKWTFQVEVVPTTHGEEHTKYRDQIAELLSDHLSSIALSTCRLDTKKNQVPSAIDENYVDKESKDHVFWFEITQEYGRSAEPNMLDTSLRILGSLFGQG